MPFHLLFVCTGNTCRSPMAEVMMRALARGVIPEGELVVASAGTAAHRGEPASPPAVEAMARRGLDLTGHRARPVEEEDVRQAHLVLTMSRRQKEFLREKFPWAAEKIYTLKEFVRKKASGEVGASPQDAQSQRAHASGGEGPSLSAGEKPLRPDDLDIADPYGGSLEDYLVTAQEIELYLRRLLQNWPWTAGQAAPPDR